MRFRYIVFGILLLQSCANKITLTGGDKDELAPVLVDAFPRNASDSFKANEIILQFDELIQLRNTNQIIVSPLTADKWEYAASGKGVKIKVPLLEDSTTYTIDFGESIVDNNESNPIKDFTYVLSTYNVIDTCLLAGSIVDHLTNEPRDQILVGLYGSKEFDIDSLKPRYICKTDESGSFLFKGIRAGNYYIRAIDDLNKDYKLQVNEGFAFNEKGVYVDSLTDTISLKMSADRNLPVTYSLNTDLLNFPFIEFSKPISSISIKDSLDNEVNYELNNTRDTVFLISDLLNSDLILSVNSGENDTLNWVSAIDNKKKELKLGLSIVSNKIKKKSIRVKTSLKIDSVVSSGIHLLKDSIEVNILDIEKGFRNILELSFERPIDVNGLRLVIDSASIFNGISTNDKFSAQVALVPETEFGKIEFSFSKKLEGNALVWLLNDKAEPLAFKLIGDGSSSFEFVRLYEGEYQLKIFYDTNMNNIWDAIDFNTLESAEPIETYGPYRLEKGWELLGNKIEL
ncbi:MAG: Ig-like domain-containing protein [Bacteroidia bacterium]